MASPKQQATLLRNHKIFRLRGLWSQASCLGFSQTELNIIESIIDEQLLKEGAKTIEQKRKEYLNEEE